MSSIPKTPENRRSMEFRKSNPFRFSRFILHVLALAALLPATLSAQNTTTIGFNTDGDAQGFTAYSSSSATFSVSVAGGLLTGTSPGGDPRLVRNSSTPIATKPAEASWTTVKFRVREKDEASATVALWSNTSIDVVLNGNIGSSGATIIGSGSAGAVADVDGFFIVTVDISAFTANEIRYFRFDPIGGTDATGNKFEVDWVEITMTHTPPVPVTPVVIFKLDDLLANSTSATGFSAAWDRLFDYSATKPLVMSVGIIGDSLETTNPAYTASIRQIHDAGRVEFWNHGYLHVRDVPPGTFEFRGTTYDYQLSNFQITQTLARERLGFPFTTFGSPFNANDAVTRQVIETDPDMRTSFFGSAAFGPTDSRLLDLDLPWLNIEVSTGNLLDYNTLVTNYSAKKNQPYLVLQGHPGGWNEAEFETFKSFVDYLIADGVTFMTPSAYRASMDTDNDGVPDVIERVLGRNPAIAEFSPPVSLDLSESRVVFEVAAGQPARPRLALESSNDMGIWVKTPISADFITTLPDGRRRVEVPVSPGAERTFWRLSESSDGVSTWP
jgi:hypothetical protein